MNYLKIYTTFAQDTEMLNDAEMGRLVRAMIMYANTENDTDAVETLSGRELLLWPSTKRNIDNELEAYQKICDRNRRNITSRYQSLPEATNGYQELPNDTSGSKEKDKDIKKEDIPYGISKKESTRATSRFVPPTLEEVTAYCKERRNGISPSSFIDFYESKDWMIGKNKMKNWKAAIRTWERGDRNGRSYNSQSNSESVRAYGDTF